MTGTGESTMQKVKDVLHLNKGHTDTTHTTTTDTTHTSTAGTHVPGTTHTGAHTGTHVPGTGAHTGTTGTTGGVASTHAEGTHGPHSSRMANAADPRIDSDMDGNRIPNQTTSGYGTADHNTLGSTGATGAHHHPHGTTTGNHVGGTGFGGGISNSTNAGPHDSNLANKADPRVDSDLSGSGNRHGAATGGVFGASGSHATPGSGTAQNTAGPHNSDMMNKVDPRVDSDLDHSKTVGGNRTHA